MIDGLAYADTKIRERKARTAQRKAARKRERAQLDARRLAGLHARHAGKLRRASHAP